MAKVDTKSVASAHQESIKEQFMRRAIFLGQLGARNGRGFPYGALVVKDGQSIAEGQNMEIAEMNPSSHGEIVAIRNACNTLGTLDLSGCDLYTSCEPCPMCYSAAFYAKVRKIYYGTCKDDPSGKQNSLLQDDVRHPTQFRTIPSERICTEEMCTVLASFSTQKHNAEDHSEVE